MKRSAAYLNNELLDHLFPFSFVIDASLTITDPGKGLKKLFPKISGCGFNDYVKIKKPIISSAPDLEMFIKKNDKVFIIEFKPNGLLLRGQFVHLKKQNYALFVGTPWVAHIKGLEQKGLSLTDLALHDTMPELLQLAETQMVTVDDIKMADTRLKLNEEKYRGIINTMQLGLLEINMEDKIMYAHDRFCEMTGYSKKELLGKNLVDFLFVGHNHKSTLSLQNLRKVLGKKNLYEISIRKKSGDIIWVLVSDSPLYDIKRNIIGSVGIYLDITDRKRSEGALRKAKEEAEHSTKIKEQFLANVSHEIRTPMNSIIGMTDLLLGTNASTEQLEYLNAIKLSGDNLLTIINDILDFSKIASGKVTIEKMPFSLPEVIEGVVQTLQFSISRKKITFNYSLSPETPSFVIGDPVRLRQILLNLASNAVKFTENGSVEIVVTVQEQKINDYTLLFSVNDTGIGIPEEKLSAIFDSFTQASNDTTRKYGGTGLGLTIAKQLVEMQGGTIHVKSTVGMGSSFFFNITYRKSTQNFEPQKKKNKFDDRRLVNKKILLVEDNEMNQLVASKVLNKWGCEVDIADNGKIAVQKLNTNDYEIILMDMQMPEMDGYEAARYIRGKMVSPKSDIPIIAMTAHAFAEEIEKCKEAGMNDYISKPFDQNDLYEKIAKLVGAYITLPDIQSTIEMSNEKICDLTYLKEISDGSREFETQMIITFNREIPKMIEEMQMCLEQKKWVQLKGIAHKMRPSIDFMGIVSLKNILKDVERFAGETIELDKLPAMLAEIKSTSEKAYVELSNEIK